MNISIDIGTSYSCCFAQLPNGELIAIKVSTGISAYGSDTSMPSAVFRTQEGKELLGQAAMNSRLLNPASFCKEFKRNLGQTESITLGNKAYSPQDFYTLFFSHMCNRIYQTFPGADLTCYLTCPVTFTENQRSLVLSAAQNAGLFNATLIDEPVAAVQGCRSLSNLKDGVKILVYDFGGGTFDAALVEYTQGSFHALGSEGISDCGGSNIDWQICQHILKQVPPEQMKALQADTVANSRFAVQVNEMAVKAKHHLSYDAVFSDTLPMGHYTLSYTLSREQLEGMIAPMVANTIACCRNLLQAAKWEVQDLAYVLLVGGTSRIPLVQREVQKLVGTVPWQLVEDPELAVARGALFHNVGQIAWKMYQQGQAHEKENLPVIAFGYYQQAAQAGLAEAQYALAKLYQTGMDGFMEPDLIQAEHWYHQAALQDQVDAVYCLAEICRKGGTRTEEEWLGWYQKAAEQGHPEAQYQFGCYSTDEQTKIAWFTKAAEQKHTQAMYRLGRMATKTEDQIKWYTMAAEQGHVGAMKALGELYRVLSSHENAVKWYLQAAEQKDCYACAWLGWYSEQGIVLENSREAAIKWYLQAVEGGYDPLGCSRYRLGVLYEAGGEYVTAAQWYEKVDSNQDHSREKARCALAQLYYDEKIPGKGVKDAKELFLKLAQEGFAEAQYRLGLYYEEGAEGSPNYEEMRKWYQSAADNGHSKAQYKLGCIMLGLKDSYELHDAHYYLEKSAIQGYVPAMNRCGAILLDYGKLDAAAEWLQKSAERGDPEGQFHLALIYYDDAYSGYDEEKGRELLLRSAEAGDSDAQATLGYDYLTRNKKIGEAPNPEDIAQGLMWYRKAAEHGSAKVQRNLADILKAGQLVQKDLNEAEKWYRKSAEQGDQYSMEYLQMLLEPNHPEEATLWKYRASEKAREIDYEIPKAEYYRKHGCYDEAFDLYDTAADAGIASAMFAVAEFYEQGLHGFKSKGTAESYYKKAYAAQSWDSKSKIRQESAYRLARYYEGNVFLFSKKKLAEEWYRKAAEAGHQGAQQWLEAKQKNI